MKYPPSLLDEIRARLPVSQVVGRKVALKKAGREWKGLSPFKSERTPSFFVNDQKGFYHCFASGAHGDIFRFLMETEGLSFPEAVERLAEEAGVALPKFEPRSPEQRQQIEREQDERTRLYALLEASARFFEASLAGTAAPRPGATWSTSVASTARRSGASAWDMRHPAGRCCASIWPDWGSRWPT